MTWRRPWVLGEGLVAERCALHIEESAYEALAERLGELRPEKATLLEAIATRDPSYNELPARTVAFLLRTPMSRARLLAATREARAALNPLNENADQAVLEDNASLVRALLCYDALYGGGNDD